MREVRLQFGEAYASLMHDSRSDGGGKEIETQFREALGIELKVIGADAGEERRLPIVPAIVRFDERVRVLHRIETTVVEFAGHVDVGPPATVGVNGASISPELLVLPFREESFVVDRIAGEQVRLYGAGVVVDKTGSEAAGTSILAVFESVFEGGSREDAALGSQRQVGARSKIRIDGNADFAPYGSANMS